MDVGKSFTFMFEDKNWIAKIAIGGLVTLFSFLLIPIPLLVGYALRTIKNVAEGASVPLPEWDNIGDMYVKGLTAIVGVVIWALPVIILSCCMVLVSTALASGGSDSSSAISSLGGIVLTCLYCLVFVVGIAINLFVYAPLTNFALNNQINTFWDFAGAWRFIQANAGNYIIAFLLALVANFVAGFGVIACFIGVFFTSFWALLVMSHLFGEVARNNMTPTDSSMLPPTPPSEPPSILQGPIEPAASA